MTTLRDRARGLLLSGERAVNGRRRVRKAFLNSASSAVLSLEDPKELHEGNLGVSFEASDTGVKGTLICGSEAW